MFANSLPPIVVTEHRRLINKNAACISSCIDSAHLSGYKHDIMLPAVLCVSEFDSRVKLQPNYKLASIATQSVD